MQQQTTCTAESKALPQDSCTRYCAGIAATNQSNSWCCAGQSFALLPFECVLAPPPTPSPGWLLHGPAWCASSVGSCCTPGRQVHCRWLRGRRSTAGGQPTTIGLVQCLGMCTSQGIAAPARCWATHALTIMPTAAVNDPTCMGSSQLPSWKPCWYVSAVTLTHTPSTSTRWRDSHGDLMWPVPGQLLQAVVLHTHVQLLSTASKPGMPRPTSRG